MLRMNRRTAGAALAVAALIAALALGGPGAARGQGTTGTPGGADSATAPAESGSGLKGTAKGAPKKAGKQAKKGARKTLTTKKEAAMPGTMPVKPEVLPQHVQVQHILIGFAGSVPGKNIQRSKEEARKLAYEILERARGGEDFAALVREYTDDSPPGIYGMSGVGVPAGPNEYPRDRMVPAFGNVGFNISPGNIGIADYDPKSSPYGWHVIKRLQ